MIENQIWLDTFFQGVQILFRLKVVNKLSVSIIFLINFILKDYFVYLYICSTKIVLYKL